MAHNSNFIPSITHAMSISWLHNVQSPTLKQKLIHLANLNTSSIAGDSEEAGETGTSENLSAVLHSKLWKMMQVKLLDVSAARKLWEGATDEETTAIDDDYPDLFGVSGEVIGGWHESMVY